MQFPALKKESRDAPDASELITAPKTVKRNIGKITSLNAQKIIVTKAAPEKGKLRVNKKHRIAV